MSAGTGLELRHVTKRYITAAGIVDAVADVSLTIAAGETVAITGPSGCGKSTLLGMLSALDVPSSGTVSMDGRDVSSLNAEARAAIRRRDVGLIFQSDNLLPFLTAEENVQAQEALRGGDGDVLPRDVLARAGLNEEVERVPDELSGGQRQRVAVVRALADRPRLLVADEPTGSLDPETAAIVVDLMLDATVTSGATLVLVTHERSLAERLGRIITLRDGRVADDTSRHVT